MDLTLHREELLSNGYTVVRGVFADAPTLITDAREALVEVAERGGPPLVRRLDVARQDGTLMVWLSDLFASLPAVNALLTDGRIGRICARLMDTPRVVLAQDTAFYKGPTSGGPVGWHQDGSYWRHAVPLDLVTAWVALTDSTEASGCMQVLPQSHDWGLLAATFLDAFSADPDAFFESPGMRDRPRVSPVPLVLAPGDVSFHHALTVHGSYTNRTAAPRLGYVLHCLADHVRNDASRARFWQRRRDSKRFEGPAHPTLWPRT